MRGDQSSSADLSGVKINFSLSVEELIRPADLWTAACDVTGVRFWFWRTFESSSAPDHVQTRRDSVTFCFINAAALNKTPAFECISAL
ncbi:hypothetical protein FQA47_016057 [Oryzias melastigma]|uniref:Uncharacterized protein n=1 Tax=Oryzias melastigma TaxID=30732 RepID=A0A834L0E3_ORYME|nr:hypothetical protein FQA47_016057 [Oryzias melastigma]